MSYEAHKYYNGNLYASIVKDVKNQQLFMDLYSGTIMDVLKNQILDLYAGIAMDVKKPIIIYKTYMRVL
jgi:hypothetical protein